MRTLEDAWKWYGAVNESAGRLTRLAKHWVELPWTEDAPWVGRLERDNVLRDLTATAMVADADLARSPLDDLAILVLFSVFEANVRDIVEKQLRPEIDGLRHPALVKAGRDVLSAVEEGSFFQLLEPYKADGASDLIETVNQVRRYRNWVAHGRRPDKKPSALVTPREAYTRLEQFLGILSRPDPARV